MLYREPRDVVGLEEAAQHADDYCGGVVGVALAWFVAGGAIAIAITVAVKLMGGA